MFWKHVLTLLTGAAAGQLIAYGSAPVLTRLYSPSQLSTAALLVAVSSIASVIATLRYDIAIMLPEREDEAAQVAGLTMLLACCFCVLLMCAMIVFQPSVYSLLSETQSGKWLFAVPPLTLLMAGYSTLSICSSRNHRFRQVAFGSVAQQSGYALTGIALGLSSMPVNGLVVGRIVGQLAGTLALLRGNLEIVRAALSSLLSARALMRTARVFWQFPLFNTPYSLVGTFSRELIVLVFSMTGNLHSAGCFALARTMLYAPVSLISAAVGPVFYREAAADLHAPTLQRRSVLMFFSIAWMVAPGYVFFAFWGPEVFELIFGMSWREAGVQAAILTPVGFLMLFTSWPERIFEVARRQHWSLGLQVLFDSVTIGAILFLVAYGAGSLSAVVIYGVVTTVFNCAYLAVVFSLLGLPFLQYLKLLGLILTLVTGAWLAFSSFDYLLGRGLAAFLAGLGMLMVYSLILFSFRRRLIGINKYKTGGDSNSSPWLIS